MSTIRWKHWLVDKDGRSGSNGDFLEIMSCNVVINDWERGRRMWAETGSLKSGALGALVAGHACRQDGAGWGRMEQDVACKLNAACDSIKSMQPLMIPAHPVPTLVPTRCPAPLTTGILD